MKAHADVVVCQERQMENQVEIIYWGAFLKDEADIEPMALEESDAESFYWQVAPRVPDHLRSSYDALKRNGGPFSDRSAAARVVEQAANKPRSTAYRHVGELVNRGLLVEKDGQLVLADSPRDCESK